METGANLKTLALSAIGATALQLTTASVVTAGVYLKASSTNTGIIYVGPSTVTAGTLDATDGFELSAGEAMFIEIANPSLIYVVYSSTGGRVSAQLVF